MIYVLQLRPAIGKLHIFDHVMTEGGSEKYILFLREQGYAQFDQETAYLQWMNNIGKAVGNVIPDNGRLAMRTVMQTARERQRDCCIDQAVFSGIILDEFVIGFDHPEFILIVGKHFRVDIIQEMLQLIKKFTVGFQGEFLRMSQLKV